MAIMKSPPLMSLFPAMDRLNLGNAFKRSGTKRKNGGKVSMRFDSLSGAKNK